MQVEDVTRQCIELEGKVNTMNHSLNELPMTSMECICRICLEPCLPIYRCHCRGSLLSHEPCLLQYLNDQRRRNIENFNTTLPSCEICGHTYILKFGGRCALKTSSCGDKIRRDKRQCACYFLFACVAIIYFIFMSTVIKFVKNGLAIMLIAVGVLMTICLIVATFSWIYHYLFDCKKRQIIGVLEIQQLTKKQFRPTQYTSNETQQSVFAEPLPMLGRRRSVASVSPM